jgi:hypothetical protein
MDWCKAVALCVTMSLMACSGRGPDDGTAEEPQYRIQPHTELVSQQTEESIDQGEGYVLADGGQSDADANLADGATESGADEPKQPSKQPSPPNGPNKMVGATHCVPAKAAASGMSEGGDKYGYALASGDFNGDGQDDLAVGAPFDGQGDGADRPGRAYLLRGTEEGLVAWDVVSQDELGDEDDGDRFGVALAVGDFDGNGYDDLAVGAPGDRLAGVPEVGSVFLYKGTKKGLVPWLRLERASLDTAHEGDHFGDALAVGDVNGDGHDELAVGAPHASPVGGDAAGVVLLFRRCAKGLCAWASLDQTGLDSNELDDQFGSSLAVGDFDHDGWNDVAVGAPTDSVDHVYSGEVFLFRGGEDVVPEPWVSLSGAGADVTTPSDFFGWALAAADLDGEGGDELVVGVPGYSSAPAVNSGAVEVYGFDAEAGELLSRGRLGQSIMEAEEHADRFGAALATGHLNDDHRADLVVGAWGETLTRDTMRAGAFYVFHGGRSLPGGRQMVDEVLLTPPSPHDAFGAALALGDFDGDGALDVAAGAPGKEAAEAPAAGRVFLFQGIAGRLEPWQVASQEHVCCR